MPFTALQIQNIANAALDFHLHGPALDSSVQDKPLLAAFKKAQKTFPGGKGNITIPVKGDRTSAIMGYTHDDTVTYQNPANIKRATYPWKEIHAGISFTNTELKVDGISVVDSLSGKNTVEHTERELTALTGILEDKLDDLTKGFNESFERMLYLDGTQDSKQVPGLAAIVAQTNTTGLTGGIDRGANTWWRNRSLVGASKIVSSTANQTLTKKLRSEVRLLRRFGGRPNLLLCGSTFLDKLEAEMHEKGNYTLSGWAQSGKNDIALAMISMKGVGDFQYAPTLDDLGLADFVYILDTNHLKLYVMDGEDMKAHAPARPFDKYVYYRAVTWTGGLCADQLNCHGVYQVS
jgi:hypothetical protein